METMLSENPYFRATLNSSLDTTVSSGVAPTLSVEERSLLAARASLFLRRQNSPLPSPIPRTSLSPPVSSSTNAHSSPPANSLNLSPAALAHIYSMGATRGALGIHLWSQWAALHGLSQAGVGVAASLIASSQTSSSSSSSSAQLSSNSSSNMSANHNDGAGGTGVRLPRPVYPPLTSLHHRFAPYFYPRTSNSPTAGSMSPVDARCPSNGSSGHNS